MQKAFMATLKKKNPKDTSNCIENSEFDGSSSTSDAGKETGALDESLDRSEIFIIKHRSFRIPEFYQPATAGNLQQKQNTHSSELFVRMSALT